jgi:hypothetical protein
MPKKIQQSRTGPRNVRKTRRTAKLAIGSEKNGGHGSAKGNLLAQAPEAKRVQKNLAQKVHAAVRVRSNFLFCS